MKIFDYKQEFYELNRLIEAQAEGFDPDTGEFVDNENEIRELAEELKGKRDDLIDFLADKRNELRGVEAIIGDEIKRLQERKKSYANQQNRLLQTIDYVLEGEKAKTVNHTFSYRKTESVDIIDEGNIPQEFIDFTPKINKSELKKHLKAGEEIKGAILVEKIGVTIR